MATTLSAIIILSAIVGITILIMPIKKMREIREWIKAWKGDYKGPT